MNKETFFIMTHDIRAEAVNQLLHTLSLKEVADKLEINYSTFTKEMQSGDYVFIQRDNRYYKFLRDPRGMSQVEQNEECREELMYLKDNFDKLRKMIDGVSNKSPMILDPRIHSKNAQFSVKSIKMNEEIYGMFTAYCQDQFPYLRVQDLIAHSMLDFIAKY